MPSIRPVGILGFQTQAAATAFPQIELDPVDLINIVELGISLNAAPNSILAPVSWVVQRQSTGGTGGTAQVVQPLIAGLSTALGTLAKTHQAGTPFTADGTTQDELHRFFVPNVSGMIWVAAPGREFDCEAADFMQLDLPVALGSGIQAETYFVFEE